MPPHQGHVYLCEFARQYCEKLIILVCSMPDEPIPGKLRYEWMKELFPDCHVVHLEDADAPQEPSGEEDPAFWLYWHNQVRTAMQNYALEWSGDTCYWNYPDVVFASEDYGHKLAASVCAKFVPVDIKRSARAVSGTNIRTNPYKYWDYIPHVVRPYYTKRVTLFGPESTGKSTLAGQLGEYFRTVVVPEYGRTYTETFGTNIEAQDLANIVAGHTASVAAAARQADKVIIEDTDPVMTAVWSDMLLQERDPWFDTFQDHPDLYILTDLLPWVDDGTRYFSSDDQREKFMQLCEAELIKRGVKYIKVTGSETERFKQAVLAIKDLFSAGKQ